MNARSLNSHHFGCLAQALRQPAKKNMLIRTRGGTPRLSRPLGRPAARNAFIRVHPWPPASPPPPSNAKPSTSNSPASKPCVGSTQKKRFDQITPFGYTSQEAPAGPDGGAHYAPEPLSMRLRPYNPVLRTSPREPQKTPPPPPHGNPRKTHGNPRKTQENPRTTHRNPSPPHPRATAASGGSCVPGDTPMSLSPLFHQRPPRMRTHYAQFDGAFHRREYLNSANLSSNGTCVFSLVSHRRVHPTQPFPFVFIRGHLDKFSNETYD